MSKENSPKLILDYFNSLNKKIVCITKKKKLKNKYKNIQFLKTCKKQKFIKLVNSSGFIITSAGTTIFDLIYLRKKFLAVKTSNNQKINLKFLKSFKMKYINDLKNLKIKIK